MKQVFYFQERCYNFCSETSHFVSEYIKTTHYDIQSVTFLEPKIYDTVPQNMNEWYLKTCNNKLWISGIN